MVVLEARDRVGGRLHSIRLQAGGETAELGGEWIEPGYEALPALSEELGVKLVPTGVDYGRREAVGSIHAASRAEVDEFRARARAARATIEVERAARTSLGAFLAAVPGSERQHRTLRAVLQGTLAQDLDRIALSSIETDTFGPPPSDPPRVGDYRRAAEGNDAIARALAARLADVRLGHRAQAVREEPERITVSGRRESGPFEIAGVALIVALPAPIVASLRFDPGLPAETAAAYRELPMGVASKFVVALRDAPAPRGLQEVETPFWCYVANGETGAPRRVLTSFAGSPRAQEILHTAKGDPEPWRARLAALTPDLVFVGTPRIKAWAEDDLARGAYAAFDSTSYARAASLAPRYGRIAFAGEHTAGAWSGSMEGAIRSGHRAAEEIRSISGR